MSKSVITVDSFASEAKRLRRHFEDRFTDPRGTDGGRFVWDYWHVPGQYTALRTPAYLYFPKSDYDSFHQRLVWWGRRNLGCHDVSPPWLSCYVHGCKQELHGDLPHGPWAFVYSLTPWSGRRFEGGETVLLRDEILSYWGSGAGQHDLEREHILREVPAKFNRLTVFDPRIPHGVREVRGVHDPREGRLVIHGWFVQPRPFIEGPLSTKDLAHAIDDLSAELGQLLAQGIDIQGVLSARFRVGTNGQVSGFRVLTNAIRHPLRQAQEERAVLNLVRRFFAQSAFRKQRAPSDVTLPLIFER
ncbi:MAG: hypothetical protein NDI61_07440 [Bdellovibrionaceae bacterium]|nr:hypothetical protein [Pseudobdellovibrionaceae bacterium]